MARVEKKRKQQAAPKTPLELLMHEHLAALGVRGYSANTIHSRRVHLGFFIEWAYEHGLREPIEVTRPVLERYQRYLFFYRKKNGEPLTFRSQHARLVPLRVWFRWMTRQNHILHNPASEIELPRLGRSLPKNIFSAAEVERIMQLCEIEEPIGLRDRALMEVIYSTGMRRLEIIHLKLFDLALDRGLILIRQGKGNKDRYVPIGERAIAWLQKYIRESRPQLAIEPAHNGHADARERSRHPFYPADAWPRGLEEHTDLHAGCHPHVATGPCRHASGSVAGARRKPVAQSLQCRCRSPACGSRPGGRRGAARAGRIALESSPNSCPQAARFRPDIAAQTARFQSG